MAELLDLAGFVVRSRLVHEPAAGSGQHRHTCWCGSRRGSTAERRTVSRPAVAAARPAVVSAGEGLAERFTAG